MDSSLLDRSFKWVGRTMRWSIYGLMGVTVYAFGSASFAYLQVKTGWGLTVEEAQHVRPGMGDTASLFVAVSVLVGLLSVLAIRVVRRLEERADEA